MDSTRIETLIFNIFNDYLKSLIYLFCAMAFIFPLIQQEFNLRISNTGSIITLCFLGGADNTLKEVGKSIE